MRTPFRIAVIGSGNTSQKVEEQAAEIGRHLAERGAILLSGGLGGVMEAACQGATQSGGLTVAFLPGLDANSANSSVQIPLPTGLGHARNLLVVTGAEAVIALDGSLGTLSEIALAAIHDRPVIGLNTWDLDSARTRGFQVETASSPQEAVLRALARAEEKRSDS